MKTICLWSSPRNVSTALMYSFAQRKDTQVIDEPLYAHYLSHSNVKHPGQEEILAAQNNNGNEVMQQILNTHGAEILFCKQMTHHLIQMDFDFLKLTKNILFIRNPKDIIFSYSKVIPNPTMEDIGIKMQFELMNYLQNKNLHCVILNSEDLLANPESVLQKLCRHLDISFDKSMLSWQKGGRKEDGVWAKYWYKNVHQSTGFLPFNGNQNKRMEKSLNIHQENLYQSSKQYYLELIKHKI